MLGMQGLPGKRPDLNASLRSADALTDALVGPHFGVIENLQSITAEPDDLPIHVWAAELGSTAAFAPEEVPHGASGAGLTAEAGLRACLGEAAERYAAGLWQPHGVTYATIAELDGPVAGPDQFALFDSRQHQRGFPFPKFKVTDRLGWAQASCVNDNGRKWVPAVFVYQPYRPASNEPLWCPSLSTGLACGPTLWQAAAGGLCEVIERDAVSLMWLGQLVPARVDLTDAHPPSELGFLLDALQRAKFRWAIFDLSSDLQVPVYAVLLEGYSPLGLVVSFGSACHPDPWQAITKALVEAAHGRMYVKSLMRENPHWSPGRGFRKVVSFADHARFYSSCPQHRHMLERWWKSPARVKMRDMSRRPLESAASAETQVNQLADRLRAGRFDVLIVDLTTPDLEPLNLHVVRVVVPGLQPLHGDHRWPHLGGARLSRLSEIFVTCSADRTFHANPYPHPCP